MQRLAHGVRVRRSWPHPCRNAQKIITSRNFSASFQNARPRPWRKNACTRRSIKNVLALGVTAAALTAASLSGSGRRWRRDRRGHIGRHRAWLYCGNRRREPAAAPAPSRLLRPGLCRAAATAARAAGFNRRKSGRAMPMSFSGSASVVNGPLSVLGQLERIV